VLTEKPEYQYDTTGYIPSEACLQLPFVLWPTQPPIQCTQRAKQLSCEADHLLSSSARVNTSIYSSDPYIFMVWYYIKDVDNCVMTFVKAYESRGIRSTVVRNMTRCSLNECYSVHVLNGDSPRLGNVHQISVWERERNYGVRGIVTPVVIYESPSKLPVLLPNRQYCTQ
jgi:hypothetical protein